MNLAELLAPLTLDTLRAEYLGKKAWLKVPSRDRPPTALLTVDDVETRLNDACGSLANLSIIDAQGRKLPREMIYQKRTGPSWAPAYVRKRFVDEKLREGCSFVMHNMTHITPALGRLIGELESAIEGCHADVHLYASAKGRATAFPAHCDIPQHKIYIQLHGSTDWTVYRGTHDKRALTPAEVEAHLEVDFRATLRPGSVLYLPPGVFHQVANPDGPRISISIPFQVGDSAEAVDRHHVPLAAIMAEPTQST